MRRLNHSVRRFTLCVAVVVLVLTVVSMSSAQDSVFIEASLRDGDWNGGQTGFPPTGGILDGPDGVVFTGRQGIISWNTTDGAKRTDFRTSGTVSLFVNVAEADFISGEVFNEVPNLPVGFTTFAIALAPGGVGADDDVVIGVASWHSNVWLRETSPTGFGFDEWHHIGVSWGGPDDDFEICVDGEVVHAYDVPAALTQLPWGHFSSATWAGLGHHHRRDVSQASVVGAMMSDLLASTDWMPACGTFGIPTGPIQGELMMSGNINLRSHGVIPVVLVSTEDFDATTVDPATLALGPAGATIAHTAGHFEDVDGDGDVDLVVHFRVQETGIACGDTEVELVGLTFGGDEIAGSGPITTLGC